MQPADLINPDRQTGYDHVQYSAPQGVVRGKPYQAIAYGGKLDKAGRKWKGPRRATASESAQDYCDFINGSEIVSSPVPKLKSAGHKRIKTLRRMSPKRVEANKLLSEAIAEEARDTSGFVYKIREVGGAVKIGESYDHPSNRVADLQTGNSRLLELVDFVFVQNRKAVERELHHRFKKWNVLGEWFQDRPAIGKAFKQLHKENP